MRSDKELQPTVEAFPYAWSYSTLQVSPFFFATQCFLLRYLSTIWGLLQQGFLALLPQFLTLKLVVSPPVLF